MTYLEFLALFVAPALALLLVVTWHHRAGLQRRTLLAFGCYLVLAVVVTAPWDSYLIANGVWTHQDVIGRLLRVPAEEYAFMIGQGLITGLFTLLLLDRRPRPTDVPATRTAAALAWLALSVVSWVLHHRWDSGFYLTAILGWFGPLIAVQVAVGGDRLAAFRATRLVAIAVPTAYLWVADRVAIAAGTWSINPELTVPIRPLGLPLEEAVFFLVTNVVLVNGLLLAADQIMWDRTATLIRGLRGGTRV